jgi:hypothetical protein
MIGVPGRPAGIDYASNDAADDFASTQSQHFLVNQFLFNSRWPISVGRHSVIKK